MYKKLDDRLALKMNICMGNYELDTEIGMLKAIINLNNYDIVLYGSGSRAQILLRWLQEKKYPQPLYILDRFKGNSNNLEGIPIILPEELTKYNINPKNIYVIIATSFFQFYAEKQKVLKILFENSLQHYIDPFDPIFDMTNYSGYTLSYYNNRKEALYWIMDKLADILSRDLLCEFIRTKIMCDRWNEKYFSTEDKYFGNGLFTNLENENFLCCGAAMGDTIFYFCDKYQQFNKIYAVESETNIFNRLSCNIELLPVEIKTKIELFKAFIGINQNEIQLDTLLKDKPISLISMDIEGSELEALRSSEHIIKEQEPVLAICIYHKLEDIIEIPKFIYSCSKNYHFFIRKYASYFTEPLQNTELVLYAIPIQRLKLKFD